MQVSLTAPYPYHGGKARWKHIVSRYFGTNRKGVYTEPFAGSLALLLGNDRPYTREVVADKNGYIVNVWNSLIHDPEATAYWADSPTYHHLLTARHRYLINHGAELAEALRNDPEFYDARMAGYWVYGQSSWIGAGFAKDFDWDTGQPTRGMKGDIVPRMAPGGEGVQVSRKEYPVPNDKLPFPGGQGVQIGRTKPPRDSIPMMPYRDDRPHGEGVSAQRIATPHDKRPDLAPIYQRGARLLPWFLALQRRLERVIVLDRDWKSAVTPAVLMQSAKAHPDCYIIMDPPYLLGEGNRTKIYSSDEHVADPDAPARDSFAWSVAHGEEYHIIYFSRLGDFVCPRGWLEVTKDFMGVNSANRRAKHRDCAFVSPRAQQNAIIG